MVETLQIKTEKHTEFVDITERIQEIVINSKVKNGVCYIFVPHTTAGITINENADPDVKSDMLMELNKIVPFDDNYKHIEGNSSAHIKASLLGFSETVFIEDRQLLLGTWQGIYFCEFDGPRVRKVYVKIVED
ncbi:secondary thiamine-phosphate synthase enzyme YjbQ [Caloranaerobacter azorensis]|uniref:YjbQ family protein n=1 Tax=Caloranaerobacter azorensis TaxID=116090 RepID=A0A6P1YF03_9FIRM|nr:secondary thiamine-phosphate synthase enzyme YjbQ [Caloranaerobacter azorensis]QIB27363.1 YjbQ family protein [Caloranaerobacter azorensis]